MPLDFREKRDEAEKKQSAQEPILHHPGETNGGTSKVVIVIFAIVVLAAASFFLYKYDLFNLKNRQAPPVGADEKISAARPEAASTDSSLTHRTFDSTQHGNDASAQESSRVTSSISLDHGIQEQPDKGKGDYTIYISRHKSKETADREAGRWKEAGYATTVTEYDGWFRVSIGRYNTWDEAKAVAERLGDSLEAGYRIGKVME